MCGDAMRRTVLTQTKNVQIEYNNAFKITFLTSLIHMCVDICQPYNNNNNNNNNFIETRLQGTIGKQ